MSTPVSITVDPDLGAVSAKLKTAAGGGRLKKKMSEELAALGDRVVRAEQDAVRRLKIRGVKRSGGVRFKRGGRGGSGRGIRENVARSIERKNKMSGAVDKTGVVIQVNRSKMPYGMRNIPKHVDKGSWRHPVFGDRNTWVEQVATPAGFFLRTGDEMSPVVQRELRRVAEKYMQEAMKLG